MKKVNFGEVRQKTQLLRLYRFLAKTQKVDFREVWRGHFSLQSLYKRLKKLKKLKKPF